MVAMVAVPQGSPSSLRERFMSNLAVASPLPIIKGNTRKNMIICQIKRKHCINSSFFLVNVWWESGKAISLHSLFGNTDATVNPKMKESSLNRLT